MKRIITVETDYKDSSTATENLIENTSRKMSDHEIVTSPSVSVTSEDVARQIRAVFDSLLQQLAHLCDLMRELRARK